MPTTSDHAAEVEAFKADVKQKGETLVKGSFPQRILELNDLLAKPPFTVVDLTQFHHVLNLFPPPQSPEKDGNCTENKSDEIQVVGSGHARSFLLAQGSVSVNPRIADVIQILKPIIQRSMQEANLLKMWVTFMIPKIEDGNNFGVSIQEDMLGEISAAETEAASYYHEMTRYYSAHAKLVSKVIKYPHIEDFRRCVHEHDEKQFVSLRMTLTELRNRYATLHDVICKNLEKIKKPRNAHANSAMY